MSEREYVDYFPAEGPVAEFKGYIINQAKAYTAKYPRVPYVDMLRRAIELAEELVPDFDPTKAASFATPLGWRLLRLNDFALEHIKQQKVEACAELLKVPPGKWERRPHTDPDATQYARSILRPGGRVKLGKWSSVRDGVALIYDLVRAVRPADIVSGPFTRVIPIRITVSMQAPMGVDPLAFQDKVSKVLASFSDTGDIRPAIVSVTGTNQPIGIEVIKADGPRQLDPKTIPTARRRTGHDVYNDWKAGIQKKLDGSGDTGLGWVPVCFAEPLQRAAEAIRLSLGPNERIALDWIMRDLLTFNREQYLPWAYRPPHTVTELGKQMGVGKGTACKIRDRVVKRLRDQLKDYPLWERAGPVKNNFEYLGNLDGWQVIFSPGEGE